MGTLYSCGPKVTFCALKEMPDQETDSEHIVSTIAEFHGDVFYLLEQLGEGGMGEVFRARQRSLDRTVAIKRLHHHVDKMTPHALERLSAEAKALGSLDHPNIVKIFTVAISSDRSRPFLVLEFVEGETLARTLQKNGCMSPSACLKIMEQVLPALDYAHKNGIVHRDLKPSNLMLTKGGQVKIMDFGIAKALTDDSKNDQGLTTSGSLLGTPFYMSPEQCQAQELDGRSDIYAIGCMLYEMLTGEPLFDGLSPLDIMYKHINEEPQFASELGEPMVSVLSTALAKNPNQRFPTAAEFLDALRQTFTTAHTAVHTRRSSIRTKVQPKKKGNSKNRLAMLTLFAVLAGALVATAGLIFSFSRAREISELQAAATPRSLAEARREAEQEFSQIDNAHYKSAKEKGEALVKISEKLDHWIYTLDASNEEKAKCCQSIAFRLNDSDSPLAEQMANECLRFSSQGAGKRDLATRAGDLTRVAQVQRHKKNYKECLATLQQAASIAKEAQAPEQAGDIAAELSATYQMLNDSEKALAYAIEATKLYETTRLNGLRVACANQNAARILIRLRQYRKAEPYLEKASIAIGPEAFPHSDCYQRVVQFNNEDLKMSVAYAEKNAAEEERAYARALALGPSTVSPNTERQMMLYLHHARNAFALHPESLKPAVDTATAGLHFAATEDILSKANITAAQAELALLDNPMPRKSAQEHFGKALALMEKCTR